MPAPPEREATNCQDTFVPTTTTLNSAALTTNTVTALTLTPASLTLLQPGDVLLIGSEQLWVSAVASGVATVTRGFGSTTAATHATAATITIVSRARIDGDAADNSPNTEVSTGYNYTQILQRSIEVSRTKEKMAAYGVSSWEDYMIDKEMKSLMMFLNKLPYYGKRAVGTATAARYCGGLRTFITDNLTDCSSAALTRKNIDDTLQNIWDDGGQPDLIICNAWAQRKLNDFYEGFIQTSPDYQIGGNIISKLRHPITGGLMDVLVDMHCPTNELWLLSREHIAYYPFDPFFYERLAKVGDASTGEIVGEYGFIVRYDKSHGLVHTFSTSA